MFYPHLESIQSNRLNSCWGIMAPIQTKCISSRVTGIRVCFFDLSTMIFPRISSQVCALQCLHTKTPRAAFLTATSICGCLGVVPSNCLHIIGFNGVLPSCDWLEPANTPWYLLFLLFILCWHISKHIQRFVLFCPMWTRLFLMVIKWIHSFMTDVKRH